MYLNSNLYWLTFMLLWNISSAWSLWFCHTKITLFSPTVILVKLSIFQLNFIKKNKKKSILLNMFLIIPMNSTKTRQKTENIFYEQSVQMLLLPFLTHWLKSMCTIHWVCLVILNVSIVKVLCWIWKSPWNLWGKMI